MCSYASRPGPLYKVIRGLLVGIIGGGTFNHDKIDRDCQFFCRKPSVHV